jgi:hypothetical protein
MLVGTTQILSKAFKRVAAAAISDQRSVGPRPAPKLQLQPQVVVVSRLLHATGITNDIVKREPVTVTKAVVQFPTRTPLRMRKGSGLIDF